MIIINKEQIILDILKFYLLSLKNFITKDSYSDYVLIKSFKLLMTFQYFSFLIDVRVMGLYWDNYKKT